MNNSLKIIQAVAETIRELDRIPSGHLYAQLMQINLSLEGYEAIIGLLKKAGVIKEQNHELIWIGKQ